MADTPRLDAVLNTLGAILGGFRLIEATGRLPESKEMQVVSDVVGVVSKLIPVVAATAGRLMELKARGRDLTETEWQNWFVRLEGKENELLALLVSDPSEL